MVLTISEKYRILNQHKRNPLGSVLQWSPKACFYNLPIESGWLYGSVSFLSFGSSEESIMRLDSINVANEL